MSKTIVEPLKVKSSLAPNPKGSLKYSVKAKLKDGEEISLADPNATRAMVALMDMQAVMGGAASHFGGPSAFAEISSALHGLVFNQAEKAGKKWSDMFHLINDAGHCENGIYALKANYGFADLNLESLKGFRSIKSPLTGHGESHIWPEGVYLSNGPLGSSLPQSQGLACADYFAGRDRITVTSISDGACMEGEAKEAMAAIPGLAAKGHMAPFVMIISDNNTKLSGRIDEQSFSMNPSFASLGDLGWKVVFLEDGHDLQGCVSAIEEAFELATANPKVPVALHVKTIKGKGVKSTEQSASGGHGFPLKKPTELAEFLAEIYEGGEVPTEFTDWAEEMIGQNEAKSEQGGASSSVIVEKVQVGVAKALNSKRSQGYPVISVTADLPGSTGVAVFRKENPECSIDVGIAESNMVSMAAGLSKEGFIPVVDTFAQFGVTKGALPLIMASLSEAPIVAVYSHAGFQDAADGASHQSLSYISMMASIPHVDVHYLSTSEEADALVGQAVDHFVTEREAGRTPHSQIFFLGRENFPRSVMGENYNYQLGKSQIVEDTSDIFEKSVTLVAGGALLHQALLAAANLAKEGMGAIVVNPSTVNHPDVETLKSALAKSEGRLVTADDHQVSGGLGCLLTHALVTSGVPLKLKSLGVKSQFGQSAYLASELYAKHEIDALAMTEAARSL